MAVPGGRVEQFEAGLVFAEGDPAERFYVLLEGTLVLSRRVGADDVEVVRTSQRGVYAGLPAYLGDRVPQLYTARCGSPSRPGSSCSARKFAQMMDEWFPMALHLLEGLFFGCRTPRRSSASGSGCSRSARCRPA
jgi:CRP-like cAMP-binding protein